MDASLPGDRSQPPLKAHERDESPILQPGRNCWQMARADRFALIIDAAEYFRVVKAAILNARHSVFLIGWDFDTRIKFEPRRQTLEGPNKLGRFLRWIDRTRPDLKVYLLKWDLGVLGAFGRGLTPLSVLDWMTSPRVSLKLDAVHPAGAAHHQKIVVIDDQLAFCGGIDMTADRWDTRQHKDNDPRRRRPSGRRYGPWHDATSALDGEAARCVGALVRERWLRATGETIDPAPPGDGHWPKDLEVAFRDVDVAIARTQPENEGSGEIREIETLYLDTIAKARRSLYCESQYFASRKLAHAMAMRLEEEDPPEIVVINPISADGWMEAATMDTARAKLLALVRRSDHKGRFRIYTPRTQGGTDIYVHAKITIADNRLLRIGSSNFNNRSLGFDTECDLAIEASANNHDLARRIGAVREDLLAEHLDVTPEQVAQAVKDADGRLIPAIEALRGEGRSLVPYKPDETGAFGELVSESELLDPERPPKLWKQILRPLRKL